MPNLYGARNASRYDNTKERKRLLLTLSELERERQPFMSLYQDLSDSVQPYAGRFQDGKTNQPTRKNIEILNNIATRAHRTTAAGLIAYGSSPARAWFRFAVMDPDLNRRHAVRMWLDIAQRMAQVILQRSNSYRGLHSLCEELVLFGTGCNFLMRDYEDVVRHYPQTTGEFSISHNYKGIVDTVYRRFDMTTGQMEQQFGRERCSRHVQDLLRRNQRNVWQTIVHAIEARDSRDTTSALATHMPFRSVYFELAGTDDKLLAEGGYRRFPAIVPRWALSNSAYYGHSPAMECLPDVRGLQVKELRRAQAVDWKVAPPMALPTSQAGTELDVSPHGQNFIDNPNETVKPLWEVQLELRDLDIDIERTEARINESFFADLFRMMQQLSDTTQRTRAEILERAEERLLMLGPTSERLHDEMYEPIITDVFERMVEANLLPPPPPELDGADLSIEFISPLAQAQKALGVNAIDRVIGTVRVLAEMRQDVSDKLNFDEVIDSVSDYLGADPRIVVPNNKVALIRSERNKAIAAQQQAENAATQAQAVKDLASAPSGGNSVLSGMGDLIGEYTGYNQPQPHAVSG